MTLKKRIRAAFLEIKDVPIYVENGANYILFRSENINPNYLLGLLNSSTLNVYMKLFSSNNNIQPSELKRLPIKKVGENNKSIVNSICEKVNKITQFKYDLVKYKGIIESPSSLIQNGQSIYNAPLQKYPSLSLKGAIRLHRVNNLLYVSVADYFECEDEEQAKALEILVSKLGDLTELSRLIVPRTKDQTREFVRLYEEAKTNVAVYPERIDLLEREIDKLVYELYELSPSEIDLIENKRVGFAEPSEDD